MTKEEKLDFLRVRQCLFSPEKPGPLGQDSFLRITFVPLEKATDEVSGRTIPYKADGGLMPPLEDEVL